MQGKKLEEEWSDREPRKLTFSPGPNHTIYKNLPKISTTIPSANVSSIPSQFHQSFHDKWKSYHEKRERIFNETSELKNKGHISPRIIRTRERHKELRIQHRQVESVSLAEEIDGNDSRPFAEVEMFGEMVNGLLDSGASVTVLGAGSLQFLEKHKINFDNFQSSVKTARVRLKYSNE